MHRLLYGDVQYVTFLELIKYIPCMKAVYYCVILRKSGEKNHARHGAMAKEKWKAQEKMEG